MTGKKYSFYKLDTMLISTIRSHEVEGTNVGHNIRGTK